MKTFSYLLLFFVLVNICPSISSLKISCGTRGASVNNIVFPDTDLRELNCACDNDGVGTFGFEKFSEIFNPYINAFVVGNRPVSQQISHIVLRNCRDINLELDLINLRRDGARITDLSFQNINTLNIRFSNIVERRLNMIFDNIISTELSGSLQSTDLELRMFFREPKSRQGSVIFNNINVAATINVLNLQDVAHLTVANSYFRQIRDLEIIQRTVRTKCHNTVDNSFYSRDVDCSKENLFYAEYQRAQTPPTTSKQQNFNIRPQPPNRYNTDIITGSFTTVDPTSSALISPVTSRPEFIVPIVLLILVVVIGVVVGGVYYKYQKSGGQFRMEKL